MTLSDGELTRCDVAICGAGLAGSTLARQLKREMPDLSITLIDRLERPLPEGAFKVGESLVETGSHYLRAIVDLADYLDESHIRKMGFRFFFQSDSDRFHDRPEFGLPGYPRVTSHQIDRGIFENDLRRFNEEAGVTLLEGYQILDIDLNPEGDHRIAYDHVESGRAGTLEARWVVDAMGRRRFLQKRLGLAKEHRGRCSAAWFRMPGRVVVDEMAPPGEAGWHERVPGNDRYDSTNHLMGEGYWVWLIPLGSGQTSVGIVALEELHPFQEFNTWERTGAWLERHEPSLSTLLADREPLDFRTMRQYSYSTERLFSSDRWACVGEAAVFPDPFYALASDLIGFENTMVTDLIARDLEGRLEPATVERYNQFVLATNHWLTSNIQGGYRYFGNGTVMANKIMWDTAAGWASLGPPMFNGVLLDEELQERFRKASGGLFFLTRGMQRLFADWAALSPGRLSFDFIDFLSVPPMKEIQTRNLRSGKTGDEIVADQIENVRRLEEMAQAMFLVAVEDVLPEHLERFEGSPWLNAWGVGLDPEKWDSARLFEPTTPPRDLEPVREQFRTLFRRS